MVEEPVSLIHPAAGQQSQQQQQQQLEKTPSPTITHNNNSAFSAPNTTLKSPQDAAIESNGNNSRSSETSPGSRNSVVQHASPKLPSPGNRTLPSQQVPSYYPQQQQQQPGRGLAYILSGPMPVQHQKPSAQKTSPSSVSDASETTTAVNPLHWLERKCDELVGGSAEASRGATKQFASERDGIPSSSFKKPNTLHQLNNHSNSDVKGGTTSVQNGTSGGIHHHPSETSSAGNRRLNGVSFTAQALQDAVCGAGGSQNFGAQKHQHIAQTGTKRSHPDLSTKGNNPIQQQKTDLAIPPFLPGAFPLYNPALTAHQAAATFGALQNPADIAMLSAMAGASAGVLPFPPGLNGYFPLGMPMPPPTTTNATSGPSLPQLFGPNSSMGGVMPMGFNNTSSLKGTSLQGPSNSSGGAALAAEMMALQQQLSAASHLSPFYPFQNIAAGLNPVAAAALMASTCAGLGGETNPVLFPGFPPQTTLGSQQSTISGLPNGGENGTPNRNLQQQQNLNLQQQQNLNLQQASINARLMAVASGQSPLVCMYKINDGQVCGMVFHHEDEIWAHYKSSHINQITSPTVTSTTNQHNQSGQRFPLTAAETVPVGRQTTPTTTMTTSLTTPAGLAKVSSNGSLKQHSPTTGNRKQHPSFSNSHVNGNLGSGGKAQKASKTEKHQNGTSTNRFHPYSASALTIGSQQASQQHEKQQNLPLATANSTPSTSSSTLSSSTTVAQSTAPAENTRALTTATASAPTDHLLQEQQQLQQLHLLAAIASGLGAAANPYSHPGMMAAGGGGGGMPPPPPPPPPSTMLPMMFPQIAGMGSLGGVYGGGVPGISPGMPPSMMPPSSYNMPSPFGAFNIAALSAAAAAADPSQKPQFPPVSKHPQPPQGTPALPTQPPPPLLNHSQGASAQLDALAAMENKIAAVGAAELQSAASSNRH